MTLAGGSPISQRRVRRLILYSFFDPQGTVGQFVDRALESLRPYADRIVVIVNGSLDTSGSRRLAELADAVIHRENSGFDVGAHRAAVLGEIEIGARWGEFDEIVMTNSTWYGPVGDWAAVFTRMNASPGHFWGVTDHAPTASNPLTRGPVPYHLQSYWIVVRREMFLSADWASYWGGMKPIVTYADAVVHHELEFTAWFTRRGWRADVAFGYASFTSENPSLFEADALIRAGCPVLKRRALFHWPPLLISRGVTTSRALEEAGARGYPTSAVLADLSRTVPPGVLNVGAGLNDVLIEQEGPAGCDASTRRGVLIIAHVAAGVDPEPTAKRVAAAMASFDAARSVITTTTPGDASRVRGALDGVASADVEVRVLTHDAGGATGALLLGCRDVVLDAAEDLVLWLGDPRCAERPDVRLDRVLTAPGLRSSIARMWDREPALGAVFAPADPGAWDQIGDGWRGARDRFIDVEEALGLHVPPDDVTPLGHHDGAVLMRLSVLAPLVSYEWSRDGFDDARGEELRSVIRILIPSLAGERGMHCRTVALATEVSSDGVYADYALTALSAPLQHEMYQRIDYLRHSGPAGSGDAADILRMYVRRSQTPTARLIRRIVGAVRRLTLPRRR